MTRHNCIGDCIAALPLFWSKVVALYCLPYPSFGARLWHCIACLTPLLKQGCGIGPGKDRSRHADILISNWSLSLSAAFDINNIHPSLNNPLIAYSGRTSGASAAAGEQKKHDNNGSGCLERGWICVPLVAEACEGWGNTANETFSRIARRLAIHTHSVVDASKYLSLIVLFFLTLCVCCVRVVCVCVVCVCCIICIIIL